MPLNILLMNSPHCASFQYDVNVALHYRQTAILYGGIRRLVFAECRFSCVSILRSINYVQLKENIPLTDICVISRFCMTILSAVGKKRCGGGREGSGEGGGIFELKGLLQQFIQAENPRYRKEEFSCAYSVLTL